MAVKCAVFPKEPQIRSIPLNETYFEIYIYPPSPKGCEESGTMMRSIKCTWMCVALLTHICLKRLMWADYVLRMEQHRIPKKALEEEGQWGGN
jgi:hypothetical protein